MSLYKLSPTSSDNYARYIVALPYDNILDLAQEKWDDVEDFELVTPCDFLKNIQNFKEINGVLRWIFPSCKILTQNGNILTYEEDDNPAYHLAGFLGIELPPFGSVPNNDNDNDNDNNHNNDNMIDID